MSGDTASERIESAAAIGKKKVRTAEVSELKDRRRLRIDLTFAALTMLILAVGLAMLLSASFARAYYEDGKPFMYFNAQIVATIIGILVMVVMSTLREGFYNWIAPWALFGSLALLVLVLIIGQEAATGGKRWIHLPFFNLQPSEIAKFTLIIFFARMSVKNVRKMENYEKHPRYREDRKFRLGNQFKYTVFPYVMILGVICVLLVLEPHVSACIIFIVLTGAMMFQSGTKLPWMGLLLILVSLAAVFMYKTGFPSDYVRTRVIVWRDPWDVQDPLVLDKGYQVRQSLISIGSGGLTGVGFAQSRQKHLYLPEEHNDFIFSVVCEELGYIGAVIILLLFALLIVRGYWLALRAKTKFSSLVIAGITTQLALQVFLNVAVVTNLIPCTGISLPFFSYGGSALVCQMAAMGIVLSLSRS
jgi:cell division protein FtsW